MISLARQFVQGVHYGLNMATAWDSARYTDPEDGKLGKAIPAGRVLIPGRIWIEGAFLRWHLSPSHSFLPRDYAPPKSLLNDFARLWQAIDPWMDLLHAHIRSGGSQADAPEPDQMVTKRMLKFAQRYSVLCENAAAVEGREPLARWWHLSKKVCAFLNVGAQLAAREKRIGRGEWQDIALFEEQRLSQLETPANARAELLLQLQPWVREVGFSLRWNHAQDRFELEVDYHGSMLAAMGLQLALTIANADSLFICSGCGLPYSRSKHLRRPKPGQSNFCDRDTCGIAAALRQADARRKEKMIEARRLHARDVSVNEIAERLDTTPASVRRWVKKGR